jgi:peptide/nickel transport system permease protein
MADATPADDSVFESTFESVDVTQSRWDRYRRFLDVWVYAPFAIITNDIRTIAGLALTGLFVLMGTIGVAVVPEPTTFQGPRVLGAFQDMAHPLGTTNLGVDLLSLIIHATPAMLEMLAAGGIFSVVLATIVGTIAGYKRGKWDIVLSTIMDIALTIPGLPLVIVLGVVLQPESPILVGLVLSINAWAGLARSLRSQVLTLRQESYVEASRTMGIPNTKVIMFDILPNMVPYIAINFVVAGRRVIFGSVALYFLGALPFSNQNWGVILNEAYNYGALSLPSAYHWMFAPMAAIILLTVGLTLLSQGIEQVFNPRLRARHAKTVEDEGASQLG